MLGKLLIQERALASIVQVACLSVVFDWFDCFWFYLHVFDGFERVIRHDKKSNQEREHDVEKVAKRDSDLWIKEEQNGEN